MRPELRGIEANDIPDWPDWLPSVAEEELQWFTVVIGWPGGAGADNFQVAVATPPALRIRSREGKFVGLMVDRFDSESVQRAIQNFIDNCDALTWEGAVELLRTRMRWEFEGLGSAGSRSWYVGLPMDEEEQIQELISAWNTAGRELGIRVVAPFEFKTDLASYRCIAYLPHFGGYKGTLIRAIFPPAFEMDEAFSAEAKRAGFFVSHVNVESYRAFDSDKFKDALTDWGFFGPPAMRPEWLTRGER